MDKDLVSYPHNGDSLVLVFNYPTGFCHLAQMLEIYPLQKIARSEVLFVLSKPSTIEKEIDCGEIINPHLDYVEDMKYWTKSYLNKSWQDVISNIVQIQSLQLKNYQYEMQLLKYKHIYNSDTVKPLAHTVYRLEDKINRIKRATTLLQNVISEPIQ